MYPKFSFWIPNFIKRKLIIYQFIKKLPSSLKIILGFCASCNYFNNVILREISVVTKQDILFSHEFWHWIIDLEITQSSSVADDFYEIKPHYRRILKKYVNQSSTQYELAKVFENCVSTEIDPQTLSLYKAEKVIHEVLSHSSSIDIESIADILYIFRYKKSVTKKILVSLSKRLPSRNVYRLYQIAATVPTRKNISSVLVFPVAIILEKVSPQLRPRKFTVFPLYISSLIHQTWSNHEKAIEILRLAIHYIPDENSKLAGILYSRLALSYMMVGYMRKAKEVLLYANTLLKVNSNEWIDNQLNQQIWHLKQGSWQEALKIGLALRNVVKDPYLKAKHSHILAVSYLYIGDLNNAEKYAKQCEELSSFVTFSSWVIGKAWRNRFAYALLSTINLIKGVHKSSLDQKLYFRNSLQTSRDITRQLNPLFRWILGCTVESHLLYTEASIAAIRGNYLLAERKYLQLQQDKYLEVYYRISSQLDLATIYFQTNRVGEAVKLYQYCANRALEFGYKYLEIRALKQIKKIKYNNIDQSLVKRMDAIDSNIHKIGSPYIDNLKFLIPV